jgi:hypothetical protein
MAGHAKVRRPKRFTDPLSVTPAKILFPMPSRYLSLPNILLLSLALPIGAGCKESSAPGERAPRDGGSAGSASGRASDAETDSGTAGAGGVASCTWPASLEPGNGSPCHANRYVVTCSLSGGGESECLSAEPTSCGEDHLTFDCHQQCGPREYGVACIYLPDASTPSPDASVPGPQGCHPVGGPALTIGFACCSCGA